MTRILTTSTGVDLGLGAQVHADTFAERIKSAMLAQGYSDIEIELVDGKLKVEGTKGGMEKEIVYFAANEEVLSPSVEADDDGDEKDDADKEDQTAAG